MYTVALIDDDEVLVQNFKGHFTNSQYQFVGSAASIPDFIKISDTLPKIDILFLDIQLPERTGLEGLPILKKMLPTTEIVMLSVIEEKEVLLKAFCLGASGYLLKEDHLRELEDYIGIIQKGGSVISPPMARHLINYFKPRNTEEETKLSQKNLQVLHLLAEGWNYKTIAHRLDISLDGVRYHIKEIYRALGVQSVAQAVKRYVDGDLPIK